MRAYRGDGEACTGVGCQREVLYVVHAPLHYVWICWVGVLSVLACSHLEQFYRWVREAYEEAQDTDSG